MTEDAGELHVLIKEANNLIAMKAAGLSDSFVKGFDSLLSVFLARSSAGRVRARWPTAVVL